VTVEVHNPGAPISPEVIEHIFDPFQRRLARSQRRNEDGVGLGLYIAREIVRAHGGTIEVFSPDRGGSTFVVRLPRVASRPAPTELPPGALPREVRPRYRRSLSEAIDVSPATSDR
jgi:phosphoserine phosphatase RsbU/P